MADTIVRIGTPPLGPLVEEFPIIFPDGSVLHGSVYRTSRRTGRRIVVRDAAGVALYDGDESYDLGNATAKLDDWLAARPAKVTCDVCGEPVTEERPGGLRTCAGGGDDRIMAHADH